MPVISIQPKDAKRLAKVAPRHLIGHGTLTKQVKWAIDEAVDRANGANGKRKKD